MTRQSAPVHPETHSQGLVHLQEPRGVEEGAGGLHMPLPRRRLRQGHALHGARSWQGEVRGAYTVARLLHNGDYNA